MEISGTVEEARITGNGRFIINITTDYDKRHSGSDTNRILQSFSGHKVTIVIEE